MGLRRHHVGCRAISKVLEYSRKGDEGKPMPIADLDMAFGKHHQADRPWHLCLSDTDGRARRESVGILHSGDHDGIGRKLTVLDRAPLLEPQPALAHGFGILQFNAVVEGNVHARHLYERLGFTQLGTIPGGFRMKDGPLANICPYFRETRTKS